MNINYRFGHKKYVIKFIQMPYYNIVFYLVSLLLRRLLLLGMGRISASASADVPHLFDIRVLSADVLRMSIFSIF